MRRFVTTDPNYMFLYIFSKKWTELNFLIQEILEFRTCFEHMFINVFEWTRKVIKITRKSIVIMW